MTKFDSAQETLSNPSRRKFIKTTATAALVAAAVPSFLSKTSFAAAGRPIKIGFVSPKTGQLSAFAEADEFVIGNIRKTLAGGITVAGQNHPVQILERDSRSDPNRGAEVTAALIKADKVDIVLVGNNPETVNPVSDQCELNGVPCISDDAPWQAYFFGRGGKPDKGFDWTYHAFWGSEDIIAVFTSMWGALPTNKVVGALFPNDADGNAWSDPKTGFPPEVAAKGYKLIDKGRFPSMTNDFSAQISAFKQNKVEIVTGVLPSPAFTTFWSQAAQQGFKPKIVTFAKALLFPAGVEALGDRGAGLGTEVWWSPNHPYKSGLTGQTAAQFAAAWERETHREWTATLGYKHALFELAVDALKRTKDINSPASIRDAIAATNYNAIIGHVQWTGKPVKNVCRTPLAGGQWIKGKKYKYELVVVDNGGHPEIPTQAKLKPLV
jgi:branched-chain amino acid transport system substrate-binding protein